MNVDLNGGKAFIADEKNKEIKVISGEVLVFIAPVIKGRLGRRVNIYEAQEGESIPSFVVNDRNLGQWRLVIVAIEKAKLQIENPENWDELRLDFAKSAGIRLFSVDEFEEQIVNQYDLQIVKDEAFIYSSTQESENVSLDTLNMILDFFENKKEEVVEEKSGNRLYNLTRLICKKNKIVIAPYEVIKSCCGKKIGISEIASISHFVSREVVLEENWYKKDAGPLLAYFEEGRKPVACIPHGPSKYYAYESSKSKGKLIDTKYASKLSGKADMVYRPFPEKSMKLLDLIKFGFQSAYKRDIVWYILMAILGTIIGLILPTINQQVYDSFIPLGDKNGLIGVCFLMLSITIGNLAFTIVKNLALFRGMNVMEYAVQNATYDRVFNLPASFFRNYDSAELAERVFSITDIFQACADTGIKTLFAAVLSLTYLIRMNSFCKVLMLPAVIMVLIVTLLIGIVGFIQIKYEAKLMDYKGELSSKMYQYINGISKIRIAGSENRVLKEYFKPYIELRKIDKRKDGLELVASEISAASTVIFNVVLYYVMVKKSASVSMGAFMGFSTAFGAFSGAVLEMMLAFLTINMVIPAYKRCKPVLLALPEFEENAEKVRSILGEIEVSNVDFAYDSESGNVLNQLSLQIKPGEYVGIVGSSGCGKSTLLKLLMGFEKPSRGRIYYDGKDLEGLDKRELRKKFGVVLQNGGIIAGSIYDNITITAPNVPMSKVEKIIEDVGLKDDIEAMPMKLHTILNETSGTISGGQKQRILIARALINSPIIIFFDEATSALDNVTQAMVVETLEKIKATKVVIAHRLSTVINCDRIIVLNKGCIEEQGTYDELMKNKGLFYDLASRQTV